MKIKRYGIMSNSTDSWFVESEKGEYVKYLDCINLKPEELYKKQLITLAYCKDKNINLSISDIREVENRALMFYLHDPVFKNYVDSLVILSKNYYCQNE